MLERNRPLIHFSAFVLWLLLFPMAGPWSAPAGAAPPVAAVFLLPHAAVLALVGFWAAARRRLGPLSLAGGIAAVVLTAAYPYAAWARAPLLGLIGAVSAPLSVRVASGLVRADRPLGAAVWGLVGANLLLPAVARFPAPYEARMALAAGVLGVGLWSPAARRGTAGGALQHPGYLGFLAAVYALNGVFYEKLFPAYRTVVGAPGGEVLAYVGALLLALYVGQGRIKPTLVGGVALGFAALVLFRPANAGLVAASMVAMQGGAGFLDAFVLSFCLAQPDPVRAFSLGLGSLCGGLGLGCLAAHLLPGGGALSPLLGASFLNGALLALYALSGPDSSPRPRTPSPAPRQAPGISEIPLSSREADVLECLARGMTNREIAEHLGISASSVQTYARRIYAKAEVSGRDELLERLRPAARQRNRPEPAGSA